MAISKFSLRTQLSRFAREVGLDPEAINNDHVVLIADTLRVALGQDDTPLAWEDGGEGFDLDDTDEDDEDGVDPRRSHAATDRSDYDTSPIRRNTLTPSDADIPQFNNPSEDSDLGPDDYDMNTESASIPEERPADNSTPSQRSSSPIVKKEDTPPDANHEADELYFDNNPANDELDFDQYDTQSESETPLKRNQSSISPEGSFDEGPDEDMTTPMLGGQSEGLHGRAAPDGATPEEDALHNEDEDMTTPVLGGQSEGLHGRAAPDGARPEEDALHKELSQFYHANQIFSSLYYNQKTRRGRVEPDYSALSELPLAEHLAPMMLNALQTYWVAESRQAKLARNATLQPVREAPTSRALSDYYTQPEGLDAADFDKAVAIFQSNTQDYQNTEYQRRAMLSWAYPVLERFCQREGDSKSEQIKKEELLYMSLGIEFTPGYGAYRANKDEIENLGLVWRAPGSTEFTNAAETFRRNQRKYLRCLAYLREHDAAWVMATDVKNSRTILTKVADPPKQLQPWIDHLSSFAHELKSRASSRAAGDYSGRSELALYSAVPDDDKALWHEYRCSWETFNDLYLYNTDYPAPFVGQVFDPVMHLKYGYKGHRELDLSWSITLRNRQDGVYTSTTMPVPRAAFIGILPGTCRYRPDTPLVKGQIYFNDPDLSIRFGAPKGLLSYMAITKSPEEGNVIGGWEQHDDAQTPNGYPWHLVLFAYKEIGSFEPLVLWSPTLV